MKKTIITIISLVVFLVILAIKVLSLGEQFSRPDLDNSAGSWTATPLWSKIDEVTASDADFITSSGNPADDIYSARLSDVIDPETSSKHIMRVRYKQDVPSASTTDLTFRLKEGTTLIHEEAFFALSTVYTTSAVTLSAAEANSITNYNNLFFEFEADSLVEPAQPTVAVVVSWAEFEVPVAGVPTTKGLLRIRQNGLLQIRENGLLRMR